MLKKIVKFTQTYTCIIYNFSVNKKKIYFDVLEATDPLITIVDTELDDYIGIIFMRLGKEISKSSVVRRNIFLFSFAKRYLIQMIVRASKLHN